MLVLTAALLLTALSAKSVTRGFQDAVLAVQAQELAHLAETATSLLETHAFVPLRAITSGTVQAFVSNVLETAQHVTAKVMATTSLLVIAVAAFPPTLQPVVKCNFTMHQVATDGHGCQLVQAIIGHATKLPVQTHTMVVIPTIIPT